MPKHSSWIIGQQISLTLVLIISSTADSQMADKKAPANNAPAAKLIHTLKGHKKDVWRVAFEPVKRNPKLVSGGQDGYTITWNMVTGNELARFEQKDFVRGLAFDNGRVWLASASATPYGLGFSGKLILHVWNANRCVEFPSRSARSFTSVAIHPIGKWAATGGEDRALRVWNLRKPISERKK